MKENCVLNLISYQSELEYNGNGLQNEFSESRSSQRTNNRSKKRFSQKVDEEQKEGKRIQATKKRISKEQNGVKNQGHWSNHEHQIYVDYLEQHYSTCMQQSEQNRKNKKIFKLMSQTIGTRSPSQCRSHHQKFNPYTAAGQKRNKRRMSIQNDGKSCMNQIGKSLIEFNIPIIKSILNDYYDQCNDYISNYEDSHPQLQNYCCKSNLNKELKNRLDCDSYIY